MMEEFHYPHFPREISTVYVALVTNVSKAAQLRARLIRAATAPGQEGEAEREAVNFAFINARLITSILHLQTAIYHALLAHAQGSLRTKTVHSEVLWNLNPSNNITEAFRRYGVSDTTAALFVVRIGPPELSDILERVTSAVKGDLSPVSQLEEITDWDSVKKYHKLNGESAIVAFGKDTDEEHALVNEIVVSSVAMKSVAQ